MDNNFERHMQLVAKRYAADVVAEKAEKYQQEHDVFKPGANPYHEGIIDGMNMIVKMLVEDIKDHEKEMGLHD